MIAERERAAAWAVVAGPWDLIVVGGGITGAGILRLARRAGLRALLVEQRDFAWGASSRSSKLAHGGLRYLAKGQVHLTRTAVRARERLLAEGPGLVTPIGFLAALYRGLGTGRWGYQAFLVLYDRLAGRRSFQYFDRQAFQFLAPHLAHDGLQGGFRFLEGVTDDARLVLRVLSEALADGGVALNYVAAEHLLREDGRVVGVALRDVLTRETAEARAAVVVNATGTWADRLRAEVQGAPRMRPLRGSHLLFPAWRFPVAQVISFVHPLDGRPVMVLPWEGATMLGTTDEDQAAPLDEEAAVSAEEVSYLMAAADALAPSLGLTLDDVVASFSGVRPVVGSGTADPSREPREHEVWEEGGLVTVTGGKWTTFHVMADDTLAVAGRHLPGFVPPDPAQPIFDPLPDLDSKLSAEVRARLAGRYGAAAPALVAAAQPGELEPIPGTPALWAELRWAARAEAVMHLDDLLLRRVRLGLVLPQGGADLLPAIRAICQPELGWDDARWEAEAEAYQALWARYYSLPNRATIPAWADKLTAANAQRAAQSQDRQTRRRWIARGLGGLALGLGGLAIRRRRAKEHAR